MVDLSASTIDMSSTAQYRSIMPRVHSMCVIYPAKLYLDMGLRKPKERVKFNQPHLSEKETHCS